MRAFGALGTSISGKGPTTFGIFSSEQDRERIKKTLEKQYPDFFIAKF